MRLILQRLIGKPFVWRALRYGLAVALGIFLLADIIFPPPLPNHNKKMTQTVVAQDGFPLRAFPIKSEKKSSRGSAENHSTHHVWRQVVRVDEVSPYYLESLLHYEDRYFYRHFGVNPLALARALWQWAMHGKVISGGSTITMQAARLLSPDTINRTVSGKFLQMFRAVQLEMRYSKKEILEIYMNHAPMGGILEGVGAASRAYFGKPAVALSASESALLAVLPQSPSRNRPDRYPAQATLVRDKLLNRMQGVWSAQVIHEAKQEAVIALPIKEPVLSPLLAERLKNAYPHTPIIVSTVDANLQESVEALLRSRAQTLPPRVSIAVLVADINSGAVLAYAGSADYADEHRYGFIDMVQAWRSPGSTLKPFLYAQALDEGLIHAQSLLSDAPQSFSGYEPGNFQANFHGAVSMTTALQRSLNVPAVQVLEKIGAENFVAQLQSGGLPLQFPKNASPNLSVILGGVAVRLEDLVSAYSSLARRGEAVSLRFIQDEPMMTRRLMSEGAAFIIRQTLESGGPNERFLANTINLRRGIAWKTGTSFGFRDAWAVGVSDHFVVGVWMGRPDGTPNPGYVGANSSAPLLIDIFNALSEPPPMRRTPPATVSEEKICWPLGGAERDTPPELCHQNYNAWILNGQIPPTWTRGPGGESLLQTVFINPEDGLRVRADCSESPMVAKKIARWPQEVEAWLDAVTLNRATPPSWSNSCLNGIKTASRNIDIVGIKNGEALTRGGGVASKAWPSLSLSLRGNQEDKLWWMVDGQVVAENTRHLNYSFSKAGRYRITVINALGQYGSVELLVN
jgi:penicillin-binding protein 1C